jgi:DNA-directed RNA polymerase subunit RPC12/RpoP
MTKKRLFLSALVVLLVVVASATISSCSKDNNEEAVPTTVVNLDSKDPYAICPHCGGQIFAGETHIHYFLPEESCAYYYCSWLGRYHRHVVRFTPGHFEDNWEHLGGGTNN